MGKDEVRDTVEDILIRDMTVPEAFEVLIERVCEALRTKVRDFRHPLQQDDLGTKAKRLWDGLGRGITDFTNAIERRVEREPATVQEAARALMKSIKNAVVDFFNGLNSGGKKDDLIDDFREKAREPLETLRQTVVNITHRLT